MQTIRRRHRKKYGNRAEKLPKMSNSERGKYYRQKHKEYEAELDIEVELLHKQVRDLELFLEIRQELARRSPHESCDVIVDRIFAYFKRGCDGVHLGASFSLHEGKNFRVSQEDEMPSKLAYPAKSSLTDFHSVLWESCSSHHTFLYFDFRSFQVLGRLDSRVILMKGILHTQYSRLTLEHLFPHVMHRQELLEHLLDKTVQYPCTYHFYFTPEGALHSKTVEADVINGLQNLIGNVDDVMWLLHPSEHLRTQRHKSLEDMLRGPSAMSIKSLLS